MGVNSGLADLTAMLKCRWINANWIGGNVMETKVQKPTPRAFYLGLVVVFAALILVAFLRPVARF
jgi:hypothetical protein